MKQVELFDFITSLKKKIEDLKIIVTYIIQGQVKFYENPNLQYLKQNPPYRIEFHSQKKGLFSITFKPQEKVNEEKLYKYMLFPAKYKITSNFEKIYLFLTDDPDKFLFFRTLILKLYSSDIIINPYLSFSLPAEIVQVSSITMPSIFLDLSYRIRVRWNEYMQDFQYVSELFSFFKLNRKLKHIPLKTSLYTDIFYNEGEKILVFLNSAENKVFIWHDGEYFKSDEILTKLAEISFVKDDVNFQKIFEGIFFPRLTSAEKEEIAQKFEITYPIKSSALDRRRVILANFWKEYEKIYLPTPQTKKFSPEELEKKYSNFMQLFKEQSTVFSESLFYLTCLYAELLSIKDINVIIDFWGDTKRVSVYLQIDNSEFWIDYEDFVDFKKFAHALREATSIYDFNYFMEQMVGFSLKLDYLSLLHSQFLTLLDFPQFTEIYLGKTFSLKDARAFGWKNFFYSFVNKMINDIKNLALVKPQVIFEKIDDCLNKARKLYSMQQLFDLYFFYSEETDGYWAYVPYCSLESWLKLNHYRYWNVKNIANFLYTIRLYQHTLKNETENLSLMFYEHSGEEFWCFKLPERLEKSLLDLYKNIVSIFNTLKTNEYVYIDDSNIKRLFKYLENLGWLTFENQMYIWKASEDILNYLIEILTVQMKYKLSIEDPHTKKNLIEFFRGIGKEIVEIEDLVVINNEEKEEIYFTVRPKGTSIIIEKEDLDLEELWK